MDKPVKIQCRCCQGTGQVECPCDRLNRVEGHPLNVTDYNGGGSGQGYVVKVCTDCGRVFGIRWQYDGGTGSDDHVKDFGVIDPALVTERHY